MQHGSQKAGKAYHLSVIMERSGRGPATVVISNVPPRNPVSLLTLVPLSSASVCFAAKMPHLKMSSKDYAQALDLPANWKN